MSSLFDFPEFKSLLGSSAVHEPEQMPPVVHLYLDPLRRKEREHIEAIFARLPKGSYKKEITDRLLSQNLGDYLGAWYELMVYDWLDKLGKEPALQPSIPNGKSRPEFMIKSSGLQIFIEVTVVQEARRDRDEGGVWWPAATRTFKKIGDKLREKSRQHQIPQGSAYVICLGA